MAEPADPSAATALSWLAKATDDLTIADLVLDSDVGIEWAACFHAQQAAEKAVKAVLVHVGVDFPKSYRLDRLARLLPASSNVDFDIEALTELAPWGRCRPVPRGHRESDSRTGPPPLRPGDRSTATLTIIHRSELTAIGRRKVAQSATCKGVCPPTTQTHDLPGPTSDDTRSGEAALPAPARDSHDQTRTARRAAPGKPKRSDQGPLPAMFRRSKRAAFTGRRRTHETYPAERSHDMTGTPNPATMTVTQTAAVLGISRSSAYECVRVGTIPSIRLGRRIVVPTQAIDELLASPHQARRTAAEL